MLSRSGRIFVILTLAFTFVLAGLIHAPFALADNTADEAELRFQRGVGFYKARKYEEALVEFFQSNRLVRNSSVILNIARCYEQLEQFNEAFRYYDEYLSEVHEGPGRRVAEESIQRLSPRVALLRVETTPPGAEIYIDRKDLGSLGVTPKVLALKPGKTNVILNLDGHREVSRELFLARGGTVRMDAELDFITGTLILTGSPGGAEVRLGRTDGDALCSLPCEIDLAPGNSILNIQSDGYYPAQLPVAIQPDGNTEMTISLQTLPPVMGSLIVTSNREGALVSVDGLDVGITPNVVSTHASGVHKIKVAMVGMRTFEQEISIEPNATVRLHADLRFADDITTAATKSETTTAEAPASVTVISATEIHAFGYTSLSEALRGVRGLYFSNDRMYEFVGVRGMAPPGDYNTRVLILYNGHALNDIYTGQAYIGRDLTIDLNDVERIEVVRGPASSIFGSSAVYGVINVVTRSNLGDRKVEVTGTAGTSETTTGRATAAYAGKSFDLIVSGGAYRSQNESIMNIGSDMLRNAYRNDLEASYLEGRDGERAYHGDARLRIGDFRLQGYINSREKDIGTGMYGTSIAEKGNQVKDLRAFVEARYDKSARWGDFTSRLYYDATRYDGFFKYLDDNGVEDVPESTSADWFGGELRYRTPEFLRQRVTVGLEYRREQRTAQSMMGILPILEISIGKTREYLDGICTDLSNRLESAGQPRMGNSSEECLVNLIAAIRDPNFFSPDVNAFIEDSRQKFPELNALFDVIQNIGIIPGTVNGYDDLEIQSSTHVLSASLADEMRLGRHFLINASGRFDYYRRDPTKCIGAPNESCQQLIEETWLGILQEDGSVDIEEKLALMRSNNIDETATSYNWSGRLALILRDVIPGGTTKLMGGTSFREPSAYELYYFDNSSQLPNPFRLTSERIWSAELEHTQQLTDDFKFVVSGYVNWVKSLMYMRESNDVTLNLTECQDLGNSEMCALNASAGMLQYSNLERTIRTEGAEISLRWQPGVLSMAELNYSFQHLTVPKSFATEDPFNAALIKSNIPSHTVSFKAMYPIFSSKAVLSVEAIYNSNRLTTADSDENGEYVSAYKTGESFWLNIGFSGAFKEGRIRYFAGVKNLLNDRSLMPMSDDTVLLVVPNYGRNLSVTLTGSY